MPGHEPASDRAALRAALSHMQIEEPGTGRRFEAVLAERQGWTLEFAERVADEYCGFLYLAATAGFEVTPSNAVDQAWHLHLEWPHYREILCDRIIGRPLEHRPGTGEPEDEARYQVQYQETLALYEQVFGKPPPEDVWPRPEAVAEDERYSEHELKTPAELCRRAAFVSLAGVLPALALVGTRAALVFAFFAVFLFGAGFALSRPAEAWAGNGRKSGGSCGGGGCGGDGSGSRGDDSGASCGGASCGGGSCGGGGCGGD